MKQPSQTVRKVGHLALALVVGAVWFGAIHDAHA